jgi:hypothetical protein
LRPCSHTPSTEHQPPRPRSRCRLRPPARGPAAPPSSTTRALGAAPGRLPGKLLPSRAGSHFPPCPSTANLLDPPSAPA